MSSEDYLKIIAVLAMLYAFLTFAFVGAYNYPRVMRWVQIMTPTFFISIALLSCTALGYMR